MKHTNFELLKGIGYVRRTRAAAVLITILVGIREETDSYLYSVTDTLSVSRGFLQ
jgi:hypothetical protein